MNNLKNIKYYIGFFLLLLISNMLIYSATIWYASNRVNVQTYNNIERYVYKVYEITPDILNFNEEGEAILKMDTLMLGVNNEEDTFYMINRAYTKSFDQCVGYIIVKETDEKGVFDIDKSNICNMVDE